MESQGLKTSLAHSEFRFIYDEVGEKSRFQAQIEAMWAISWTLGVVEVLDFKKSCEPDFVKLLSNLKGMESTQRYCACVDDRPPIDVLKSADLAYCLHWASTHAAQHRQTLSWPVQAYVILQRRKALDWTLSEECWDEVPLDNQPLITE